MKNTFYSMRYQSGELGCGCELEPLILLPSFTRCWEHRDVLSSPAGWSFLKTVKTFRSWALIPERRGYKAHPACSLDNRSCPSDTEVLPPLGLLHPVPRGSCCLDPCFSDLLGIRQGVGLLGPATIQIQRSPLPEAVSHSHLRSRSRVQTLLPHRHF